MIKPLKDALAVISRLPEDEQELAAEMLRLFAARREAPYTMDAAERAAVRQGLAEADRGEFAPDTDVEKMLRSPWR